MIRLRIQRIDWPRPALILTDTPRPDCRTCDGHGGIECEYGHPETGEYDGSDWDPCTCWDETRCWTLLPLPNFTRRWRTDRDPRGTEYSDEPPF
ncbi:hypothetical protein PUR28_11665 [Streptomyces sp. BE308]|uniref:hypothetical protein n=1 Tax=Streptomyces sp. BE308 TaxID=3002529 RepID=UPI002E783E8B|nr:hypothetical protein [Streptomyces sp. BE308]MEE1791419.1 hypothetical protein [Streptomyces sp. BE308]